MDNCSHFNCDCILHVLHALHASQKKQTSISNQVRELLKGWWLNYGETLLDAEKFCPRLLTFLFLSTSLGYTCRYKDVGIGLRITFLSWWRHLISLIFHDVTSLHPSLYNFHKTPPQLGLLCLD